MSNKKNAVKMFCMQAASVFMFTMMALGVWAQDTTTTTFKHGEPFV